MYSINGRLRFRQVENERALCVLIVVGFFLNKQKIIIEICNNKDAVIGTNYVVNYM